MSVVLFLLGLVNFGFGLWNFLTYCSWPMIINFVVSGFCFAAAVFNFMRGN